MQRVGAGLVAIQASTRMRPPDPDSVAAAVVMHAAPGSEAAAKDLLFKLDSMQAQVAILLLCSLIMHSVVKDHALALLTYCLEGWLSLAQLTLSLPGYGLGTAGAMA